jgi:3-deoxy-D-arabino-heptulosonate 7-phosphate (DAHP) synthase
MQMHFHRKLPIPQEVKKEYPLTDRMVAIKAARDEAIRAVFDGSSDKFILVIGPCSAEHSEPVLEYIARLRKIQEQVSDKIIIIPRIYTNKPRTTGQGYKGMLHQPDPEAKPDMYKGIVPFASFTLPLCVIMTSPVRTKCCIRLTTVTFPICSPTLPLVRVRWKIRSTALWQAVSKPLSV